jgi:hypothetical protein
LKNPPGEGTGPAEALIFPKNLPAARPHVVFLEQVNRLPSSPYQRLAKHAAPTKEPAIN